MRTLLQIFGLWIGLLLGLTGTTYAHSLGESYVYFNIGEAEISGRFEATYTDINRIVPLDADGDGQVSEIEYLNGGAAVFRMFADRLNVSAGAQILSVLPNGFETLATPLGAFAQVKFILNGVSVVPTSIDVDYRPFSDVLEASHLGFAVIESNTRTGVADNEGYVSLVFDETRVPQSLSLAGEPPVKAAMDYFEYAAKQVLRGFYYLLLIAVIVLPGVCSLRAGEWKASRIAATSFGSVMGMITVFALLSTAAMAASSVSGFEIPAWVWALCLALGLMCIGLMTLGRAARGLVPPVVALIGIMHGLGQGWLLAPLGRVPSTQLAGLVGFGFGFWLVLAVFTAVAFALAWMLREWKQYETLALRFGTLGIIILACIWLLEKNTRLGGRMTETLQGFLA